MDGVTQQNAALVQYRLPDLADPAALLFGGDGDLLHQRIHLIHRRNNRIIR
jgi:hypothetical protein